MRNKSWTSVPNFYTRTPVCLFLSLSALWFWYELKNVWEYLNSSIIFYSFKIHLHNLCSIDQYGYQHRYDSLSGISIGMSFSIGMVPIPIPGLLFVNIPGDPIKSIPILKNLGWNWLQKWNFWPNWLSFKYFQVV